MNETTQYGKKLLRKSFLKENAKISNNLTEDEYSVVTCFASLRKKYDSPLAREFFNAFK